MSRAISILISALGGEGGGVLAAWLSSAAVEVGLPVQRTSIPGVAQRTGATTYYLEIHPKPWRDLAGLEPVLGLHPAEAGVDIIVATELLEASRALLRGYASKNRTLLITSTHRVYTIAEKTAAVHGRFNERTGYESISALTHDAVQFDCLATAKQAGSHINAVLLGAIAGSGRLPITDDAFRAAMRREGKAIDENLRGFEAGLAAARAARPRVVHVGQAPAQPQTEGTPWIDEIRRAFPSIVWPTVREGIKRLIDYQSEAYARLYLKRLTSIKNADSSPFELLEAVARHLALWMSYEDVIRVAQLKTRPSRLQRIRAAQGARQDQPVVIVDFLKPAPAELCSLLPPRLARGLIAFVARRRLEQKLSIPLRVRTTSILGFAQMRALALLKRWRPYSYGYQEEQHSIEQWLRRVRVAAERDRRLATEIAECATLLRGYAETRQRGYASWRRIVEAVIDPVLTDRLRADPAQAVRRARMAAMKDQTGAALAAEIASPGVGSPSRAASRSSSSPEVVVHVDGR